MTCGVSSHWLTPNCSRIWSPLRTMNFSSNLSLQFALPLEGEVGRADDQNPLGQSAQLEFADQQARHDRLARAGIIGQQETHARQLQQVVVNGFKLVRQGSTREMDRPK